MLSNIPCWTSRFLASENTTSANLSWSGDSSQLRHGKEKTRTPPGAISLALCKQKLNKSFLAWLAHFILLGSLLRRCIAFVPVVKELGTTLSHCSAVVDQAQWREAAGMLSILLYISSGMQYGETESPKPSSIVQRVTSKLFSSLSLRYRTVSSVLIIFWIVFTTGTQAFPPCGLLQHIDSLRTLSFIFGADDIVFLMDEWIARSMKTNWAKTVNMLQQSKGHRSVHGI